MEKKFEVYEDKVKKIANAVLKILKKDKNAVEIYLIGNRRMRPLNKKFRGKDKATNILSFVEPQGFINPQKVKKIGEIYLNLDQISDFSGKAAHLTAKQVVIHGILHLLGYTHAKERDRMKMEKLEKQVFTNLHKFDHEFHK